MSPVCEAEPARGLGSIEPAAVFEDVDIKQRRLRVRRVDKLLRRVRCYRKPLRQNIFSVTQPPRPLLIEN